MHACNTANDELEVHINSFSREISFSSIIASYLFIYLFGRERKNSSGSSRSSGSTHTYTHLYWFTNTHTEEINKQNLLSLKLIFQSDHLITKTHQWLNSNWVIQHQYSSNNSKHICVWIDFGSNEFECLHILCLFVCIQTNRLLDCLYISSEDCCRSTKN